MTDRRLGSPDNGKRRRAGDIGEDLRVHVSNRLWSLMKEHGHTVKSLSRESGLAEMTIARILKSENTSLDTLSVLAAQFGLSAWEILIGLPAQSVRSKRDDSRKSS